MELGDWPTPSIQADDDVVMRVQSVGICGSDVHYFKHGGIGEQRVQYPHIIGHEFSGIVEAVGAGVTRTKPGDLVAVDPTISCENCAQCRAGRPHTCVNQVFRSVPGQADGCLSELVMMPERCCYPVGTTITPAQAAMCEPLSVGVYTVRLCRDPVSACRTAVLGAGPIGLSVLVAAKAAGAEHVSVTDKLPNRISLARRAGADWSGTPDEFDDTTEYDLVMECCGDQAALDQALRVLRPGGQLVIVGIPPGLTMSFSSDIMRRWEISIQNVRRQNDCMQPAVDLIRDGRVDVDFMITHRFPISESQKAFDLAADYEDGIVKGVIDLV